MGQITSYSWR